VLPLALSLAFFWHGVHMCTATVDYQAKSKTLEIMIAMSADHLEEILRKKSGRDIELDRTPDAQNLAQAYVLGRFDIKDSSDKSLKLKWVGWEIKGGNVNCYVETPVAGPDGLKLRDELLIDWQRDQVNRVLPKRDGKGKPPQLMFWVGTLGQYLPLVF
jgi:hypothetical protein